MLFNRNQDADDRGTGQTSTYFTSGPEPTVIGPEWFRFDFGFPAATVSVRGDDALLVAFRRPYEEPTAHIHIAADELPFSLGGDQPLNSEHCWVRLADDASGSSADVQLIAQGGR